MIILKILTSKWTYISLLVLAVVITILVLVLQIKSYENKLNTLNTEIENLKITNTILYKENILSKNRYD